jgi:DNA-binding NtrC family response regulator
MPSILVVDDHKAQRKNLAFYLKSQGYAVDSAESGEEAISKIDSCSFDIVISDYKLGGMSGHELMLKAREVQPPLEFIIVSGYGTVPLAVEIIRDGAADFLTKPFEYPVVQAAIEKALHQKGVKSSSEKARDLSLIGQSQKMRDIADLASRAAASEVTVLLEGEVGTGKELFARIVHQNGPRCRGRFIVMECSSGNEAELERALFGSQDSASGLLSECDGGTLYMRDIDHIGSRLQARLLRFLREGNYTAVDSAIFRKADVRLIAGSTRSLKGLVLEGVFREDLYYLLNIMPIYMPPLRSRTGDILPLVKHFLAHHRSKSGKHVRAVAPEVLSWMESYDWPGNVRELENVIARGCVLASGDTLDESLIFTLPQDRPVEDSDPGYLNATLKDNQRTLILKALKRNDGNFSRTATQLGISRTTLWRRLKKFKIEGLPVDQT